METGIIQEYLTIAHILWIKPGVNVVFFFALKNVYSIIKTKKKYDKIKITKEL